MFTKEYKKVHVGCGKHLLNGWVNSDIAGEVDVLWDLNDDAPFDNNSVDYLFSEHVLEHFTLNDGIRILMKFRKMLQPGAKIRIAVPDIVSCIESYQSGFGLEFRNKNQPQLPQVRTSSEYLNKCFREHGHKFLYDEETLIYALDKAGFVNMKRYKTSESDDKNFRNIERRIYGENSSQDSLIIEASKPKQK